MQLREEYTNIIDFQTVTLKDYNETEINNVKMRFIRKIVRQVANEEANEI